MTTVSNFIVYQVYGRLGAFKGRKRWSDDKLLSRVLSAKTYRWDNLNVLELKSRPSAGLYERCIELTKSKLPAERVVGVGIVSSFFREGKKCRTKYPYRKEALKLILEMIIVEKNADVIVQLLYAAGKNPYVRSKHINVFLPFADSENKYIRLAAVSALSNIDDLRAIKGLIKLSKDRYACVRDWATFSIGRMSDLDNDEIREALYARCTDKHYDTRMEGISGLAKRKDEGVKKYLEKELTDWTPYVFDSIRDLDAKEYLPRLEALLEEVESDPENPPGLYWLSHLKECIETLRCCPRDS